MSEFRVGDRVRLHFYKGCAADPEIRAHYEGHVGTIVDAPSGSTALVEFDNLSRQISRGGATSISRERVFATAYMQLLELPPLDTIEDIDNYLKEGSDASA